jgi:enoyl-CoA hydratase/carnithine racemase
MNDNKLVSPVIFQEKRCDNGKGLAIATLNAPKAFNALNLEMIKLLLVQLEQWLQNKNIVVIFIQGTGDKAFCAGGDVVSLYHDLVKRRVAEQSVLSEKEVKESLAYEFFTQEYKLDQLIHLASKPIVALADGYVMGGGIGLLAGASHKIATEKTIMAMPEITIGLYPDVGASYFLNNMPNRLGLFLGLTGCSIDCHDGKYIGLIDHIIDSSLISKIIESSLKLSWQDDELINHQLLSELFDNQSNKAAIAKSNIQSFEEIINQLLNHDYITDIYHAIINHETENIWFKKAQKKLSQGSPLSAHIIFRQLERSKGHSMKQCFEQELNLSIRCCQHREFVEGVRALLVDKDNRPQWLYTSIDQIEKKHLNWFFE